MFWAGLFLGAFIALVALSFCQTSGRADLEMEIIMLQEELKQLKGC